MVARRALALAWIAAPLALAGLGTASLYRGPAEVHVDFERRYEGSFVSGFHGHERMDGRGFRWTSREARISLHHLPRRARLRVEARLKGLRPREAPLPRVRFTANGATVFETVCAPGLVTYRFALTNPESELELGIHPEIFVPADYGRDDLRTLGVQVFSVHVRAQGGELSATAPMLWMMLQAGALLAAFAAAGLPLWSASALAAVFAGGSLFLLSRDSVRFLDYPRELALLAFAGLGIALVARWLFRRLEWLPSSERPAVIALLVGSFLWKLGGILFPLFVSSDADFHANRLLEVLQGNFFPTSVTQHDPPFRIPYPVSLYVIAAPWAAAAIDRVRALQVLTVATDLAMVMALVYMARRFWNDLRAGLLAGVLYQLVPIHFLGFSAGNLTNLFGVHAAVLLVAVLLAGSHGAGRLAAALAGGLALLSLTAHFGMLLAGIVLFPLWLWAIFAGPPSPVARSRGDGRASASARWFALALAVSFALAAVYYAAGYGELFLEQWPRVLERDYAAGGAVVSGPIERLRFNLPFYREQLGLVFLGLAVAGALPTLRGPRRTPLDAAAAGWLAATALFFGLDLVTALETRYVLLATPLLALFAGRILSRAADRGNIGRCGAGAALGYLALVGLGSYIECLLYRYH